MPGATSISVSSAVSSNSLTVLPPSLDLLPPVEISQELRGIEPREIHIPNNPVAAVETVPPARIVPSLMMRFLPESPLDMRPKHGARGTNSPHRPGYPKEIPPRESGGLPPTPCQCNLRLPDGKGSAHPVQ